MTLDEITSILERLEDEELAAKLLSRFSRASSNFHTLLQNRDPKIPHDEWKENCDKAGEELEEIVSEIKGHA